MPAKTGSSGLMAKLGQKLVKSHEAHKADETKFGAGGDLPAGIEGGVAQLVSCKFGQYKDGDNKGEYFFMAAGIVKEPKVVEGMRIEGLRTQIGPEPMCDTPKATGKRKTFDDHYAWVLNELRKLGINTSEVSGENIEEVAKALEESKPHFRFRTWKGRKNETGPYKDREPRVQHEWRGLAEYVEGEGGAESGVVDETAAESETQTDTPAEDEVVDYAALGEAADAGDSEAAEKVQQAALDAGVNQGDIDSAANWVAVAQLIESGSGGDEGTGEAQTTDEEEWVPKVEDVYKYKPMDAKTKKPVKKAIEVEVLTVDAENQTVDLAALDNKKTDPKTKKVIPTYRKVGWDKLESAAD